MNNKIIYFTSPGCSICVNQTELLNNIQLQMNIEIENHLITTAFDKALKYGIKSAPAMVFLQDNKALAVKTGFQSKEQILGILEMMT